MQQNFQFHKWSSSENIHDEQFGSNYSKMNIFLRSVQYEFFLTQRNIDGHILDIHCSLLTAPFVIKSFASHCDNSQQIAGAEHLKEREVEEYFTYCLNRRKQSSVHKQT